MSHDTPRRARHDDDTHHARHERDATPTPRAPADVEAEQAPRGGTLPASLLAGGEADVPVAGFSAPAADGCLERGAARGPSADFSCTGAEGVVPAVARVGPVAFSAMVGRAALRLRRRGGL
jgi:hypothetical protein